MACLPTRTKPNYCFTVAYALHPTAMPELVAGASGAPSGFSSDSDDCEMTGMEDRGDGDEENRGSMTTVRSTSSRSPFKHSDDEDDLVDNHGSPRLLEAAVLKKEPSQTAVDSRFVEETETSKDTGVETRERIGSIVVIERDLDLAIIRVGLGNIKPVMSYADLLMLCEGPGYDVTDPSVVIKTTHHAEIQGRRSATPVYILLPGTRSFQLLHNIRLSVPIHAGDCGS